MLVVVFLSVLSIQFHLRTASHGLGADAPLDKGTFFMTRAHADGRPASRARTPILSLSHGIFYRPDHF